MAKVESLVSLAVLAFTFSGVLAIACSLMVSQESIARIQLSPLAVSSR